MNYPKNFLIHICRLYFFIFFATFILPGCEESGRLQRISDSKDSIKKTEAGIDTSLARNISDSIYEGVYVFNLHEQSFRSCKNPDSLYWIVDETKELKELYKKIFPEKNAYSSAYIKVKGEVAANTDKSTAEKFPRSFVVYDVLTIERKNYENTCVPYDFWCIGSDPGWSLQISAKEKLIEFNLSSEKKIYYFEYIEPKEAEGQIIYETHNNIQRYLIKIKIKNEKCENKTSGKNYDYSVEVELNDGKIYRGCGIEGTENN